MARYSLMILVNADQPWEFSPRDPRFCRICWCTNNYNCWKQSVSRGKSGLYSVFKFSFKFNKKVWTYLLCLLWTSWRTGIWALFLWMFDSLLQGSFPTHWHHFRRINFKLKGYLSVLFTTNLLFVFPVSALISGLYGLHCLSWMFSRTNGSGSYSKHCLFTIVLKPT